MRLFFAVLLPEEVKANVAEIQRQLKTAITDSGVKWTMPEQFHFTLKFLGDTEPGKIQRVIQCGKATSEARDPFDVYLHGVGAFPNANRPSTLWLGADDGKESVAEIALQLDALLVKCGYAREKRPPTPHITLARVKSYAGEGQSARAITGFEVPRIGPLAIDGFTLMRSVLKPTGSEYAVVDEFRFPTS